MKNWALFVLFIVANILAVGQKKSISNDTWMSWTTLHDYAISNDGKYIWYKYGAENLPETLVLCSADGNYKREFIDGSGACFTEDSKYLLFYSQDGLTSMKLGSNDLKVISKGTDYKMPENGDGRWLSYSSSDTIVLKDLSTNKEKTYPSASKAWFNSQGNIFLIAIENKLILLSLTNFKEQVIANNIYIKDVRIDYSGKRLTFIDNGKNGNVLRYYELGMDSSIVMVESKLNDIEPNTHIADFTPFFSNDGKCIFFKVMKEYSSLMVDSPLITKKLNLWHYKDQFLQSQQLEETKRFENRALTAVVNVSSNKRKTVFLDADDKFIVGNMGNKFILVRNFINEEEAYWNDKNICPYELVSIKNGVRKKIIEADGKYFPTQKISPSEKFVVWYDPDKMNYFSYEIATSKIYNISSKIKEPLYNIDHHTVAAKGYTYGIGGWLKDDSAILIYDKYDIWQVDPKGEKTPQNITNAYGKTNELSFRIVRNQEELLSLKSGDTLLLTMLNLRNKDNGFCKIVLGINNTIKKSNLNPYLYYFPGIFVSDPPPPKRAKKAPVYLLQRMNATSSPNLVLTSDFENYALVSNISPQENYNWLIAELHQWNEANGEKINGILYKPGNFDSTAKYPVIFNFYERRSNELNLFLRPTLSNGGLNIPWYVSNGYLVFVPDIHFVPGHTGQSIVNSVVSAVDYLTKFNWVNKNRLGLQGHSFGGYETYYLVTHSDKFAAAQASSGLSDFVSEYGDIGFAGKSLAFQCETRQLNIRSTPWENPELYIENSPIFKANQVTTPLLIMHSKNDGAVPFLQSLEMYTALRRLKKCVWMLQYDGEDHILLDNLNVLDFTVRQQQFFDYYLKGTAAPLWMVEGISAADKGIKSGLQLDSLNRTP